MVLLKAEDEEQRLKKQTPEQLQKSLTEDCLNEHNRLRALHGARPLELDKQLHKSAQAYAEKLAESKFYRHSHIKNIGENLLRKRSSDIACVSGKQTALAWYSEIEFMEFGLDNQLQVGHFSQLIWKSTKRVGFGVARSRDHQHIYVVGHYSPPGNIVGAWKENVIPPLSGKCFIPSISDIYY